MCVYTHRTENRMICVHNRMNVYFHIVLLCERRHCIYGRWKCKRAIIHECLNEYWPILVCIQRSFRDSHHGLCMSAELCSQISFGQKSHAAFIWLANPRTIFAVLWHDGELVGWQMDCLPTLLTLPARRMQWTPHLARAIFIMGKINIYRNANAMIQKIFFFFCSGTFAIKYV